MPAHWRLGLMLLILAALAVFGHPGGHAPYYPNCAAARAAGAAPIKRDEPGYREELDADDDGVACEPYPSEH